jgi:hypothetical protein
LVSGELYSSNPLKAYEALVTYWEEHEVHDQDTAAIATFKNDKKTKDWLSQQHIDSPQDCRRRIDEHLEKIDSLLGEVFNPYGLIPIIFRAWGYSPEHLTAFLLWLLKKGQSSEEIVNSKLFHYFFISYIGNPSNSNGPVFQLADCMSQQNELREVYDILSKKSASFVFNDKGKGSASYHSSYPDRSLTGTRLGQGASSSAEILETSTPTLRLPHPHKAKAYLTLFGLDYLIELILTDNREHLAAIQEAFEQLTLEEIARCFKEVNFKNLRNISADSLAKILGEKKILQLIEQQQWVICRLMSPSLWQSFFSNKSTENKNKLIERIKSKQDIEAYQLLIALYEQCDDKSMQATIYEAVLVLTLDEEETLEHFLKKNSHAHMSFLQQQSDVYDASLSNLAKQIPPKGLTKKFVDTIQHEWGNQLESYNRFKRICSYHPSSFPPDKYARDVWIIQLESEIKKEAFDLRAVLCFFETEITTRKRLLTELLLTSTDDIIQQQVIQEIEKHKEEFKESSWRAMTISAQSLTELTSEY